MLHDTVVIRIPGLLLVAGFSIAAKSMASHCNTAICGDIDRGEQNSNCFEGRNDEKPEMAMDSDEFEFRAVPAICLTASEHRQPGPVPKLPLHRVFNYILQTLHLGCQWKELPIEKIMKAVRKFITRASTARFEGGKRTAALTPFLQVRWQRFIKPIFSTHCHPWRWYDDIGEERRRQHRFQRAQEGQGRQDRRLLRSQLQCHRAVCFGAWQSQ